jgi:hypothetical protein
MTVTVPCVLERRVGVWHALDPARRGDRAWVPIACGAIAGVADPGPTARATPTCPRCAQRCRAPQVATATARAAATTTTTAATSVPSSVQ